jgi:GLPGLI family protein
MNLINKNLKNKNLIYMKNTKLLLIAIFICSKVIGQNNLLVEYEYKNNTNYVCNSELLITKNEAVYKINDKREQGVKDNGETFSIVYNDPKATFFYSNDKETYTRIPLYGNEVLYSQSITSLKFDLTGQTKVISNYNCNQAKLKLNGRNYDIWFTTEINTNFGPFKINGLPGLIVELKEETNKISISLKSIKELKETKTISECKEYFVSKKILSYVDYEKEMIKIMTAQKAKNNALLAEMGASMEYDKEQKYFTEHIIDIPKNLVKELKKIN